MDNSQNSREKQFSHPRMLTKSELESLKEEFQKSDLKIREIFEKAKKERELAKAKKI
jgi:hypothetical protein